MRSKFEPIDEDDEEDRLTANRNSSVLRKSDARNTIKLKMGTRIRDDANFNSTVLKSVADVRLSNINNLPPSPNTRKSGT